MTKLIQLLVLLFASTAIGQWRQTSGPEGGNISNLTMVNSKLVVQINHDNLYRLEGEKWEKLPVNPFANELYAVGGHLIAARWDGLHLSTDEGDTWTWALELNDIPRISIDKDTMYAIHANGLFRSSDRGLQWSQVEHGPALWTVAAREGIVVAAPLDNTGVLRSTDHGRTYEGVNTGLPDTARVAQLSTDHGFFYAGTNAGIFRSTDEGLSWERFEKDLPGGMPKGNKKLIRRGDFTFLLTDDTTYIATLNGWKVLSAVPVNGVIEDGSVIYAGRLGDVHTTFFMGDSWLKTTPPLLANNVRNIVIANKHLLADGATGIFRTSDEGHTWERVNDLRSYTLINIGSSVFALGMTPENTFTFIKSPDQGMTWQTLEPPVENLGYIRGIGRSSGGLFAAVGVEDHMGTMEWIAGGVLISTDRGISWIDVSNGLPKKKGISVPVYSLYIDDETQLVATADGLYRSTDGGELWVPATNGISEGKTFRPQYYTRIGQTIYASSDLHVYATTDHGASWTKLHPPQDHILGIGKFENELYTLQYHELTFKMFRLKMVDDSLQWVDISDRLPAGVTPIKAVEFGTTAYLGTMESGLWIYNNTASVEEPLPMERSIAYPNPAIYSVTIPLEEEQGNSTIEVHDMLSRQVASINVSVGHREVIIDTRSFIPGRYSYFVHSDKGKRAGSFTVIR